MDNEISHAFKNGDYKKASELLQKVRDPNNVDLLGFYPDKYKHIDCHTYKVSLLHLAAYHGWLNICHRLITKYNHDLHVHKVCQSLIDHSKQFKQYSGSLLDISKQGQKLTVLDDVPPPPPPLFYATLGGHYEVVKYLINECNCDPHQKSAEGETPLYLACLAGHYDIVTYLINKCHSDPNTTIEQMIPVPRSSIPFSSNSTTPLYGLLSIVDHILYTPLHIACRYGHLDIVKFLVSVSSVDVNSKDSDGYTPLHTACRYSHLDIVECLLTSTLADVNSKNSNGYTPLHTACRYNHSDIVECLLSSTLVDVNIKNNHGDTPLHIACQYGELQIVQLLMSTAQINPMSTNAKHDTPLHIACAYCNASIVKYLLSTGYIDPMARNRYQETPAQLAGYGYGILKLFEPFKQCRVDFPVESNSKVFLCGNTTNGKSSLASSLCQRVKTVSMGLLEWLNPFKQQEKAEPLTAGIVPHHLESIEIGDIVLYDCAGHPKYHSSHAAVLEKLMLRSPAVFIILIKLTDKLDDIKKQLYYWVSFIQNIGCRVSKKSQVIVVGSHADSKEAKNVRDLIESICLFILKKIKQLEYKGFVAMDCRKQNGTSFDQFITYLSESTQSVVDKSDNISFYCHVLYAFLVTKIDEEAISSANLARKLQDENAALLPSNESVLFEFLTILSDKGLILFIRSTDYINSWVIINKSSLLKMINGTLFAPSHFKEYRSTLASNTGIVPVSVIRYVFHQYECDMLVEFLKSLEFCHEIDENTLKRITNNLSSSSEKLLYFPALVSVEPASEMTVTDGFGWCLWCPNPYQFFSTRFLQVLLTRIAYRFSLQLSDVGIIHRSPVESLDRSCHVWKNGICWTRDGVKTVVQVSEQNRSIVLLVQPLDESLELEGLQVVSSVSQRILQIKQEFCHSCDTQECLISPRDLNMALKSNIKNLSVFKIEDIARVLVMKKTSVTNNKRGSETLSISLLLGHLEPYHSLPLSVIHQLFDDSKVNQYISEHLFCDESRGKQYIPEDVFRKIQERCRPIMDIYPVTRESSTYQSVRDHLNRFSIFAGRNPFVSE